MFREEEENQEEEEETKRKEYPTPQCLIHEFMSIKNVFFDENSEYHSLTEYVNQTSKKLNCPMSAFKTGNERTNQVYKCRFGGIKRGRSVKKDCPCCVKFRREKNGSYSFYEGNWIHNHSVKKKVFDAHFSLVTKEVVREANRQQMLKVPPAQIRTNCSINSNSDIFYEMRRKTIHNGKSETFESFKEKCVFEDFYSHINAPNNQFEDATYIQTEIAESAFATDYLFIDDTSGTNVYDKPLEIMIVIDPEKKSQILGFSILKDQQKESYAQCLTIAKSMIKCDQRIVCSDRSPAQIWAIKNVFPSSLIVFCLLHIKRDLEKCFGETDEIVLYFNLITNNYKYCDWYVGILQRRLPSLQQKEGYKIIDFLLSNLDSWLPSRLIQQGATFAMTNNRSEGFFGLFKSKYGYSRVTLTQLVTNLVNFARLMQVQSERKKAKDQNFYDGFNLLPNKDLPQIGHMALKILSEEYTSFLNKYDNSPFCTWCHLRNSSFHAFALPCRHIMTKNQPQFKLRDFHPRYLRIEVEPTQIANSIDITPKTNNNNLNSYTNIMATLSPYASVAPRVPEVMSIFNDAIDKLHSTKSNINEGMPPTLAIKGKLPAHPANNVVLAGAPKTKKNVQCSYCHEFGHNEASCKKRKADQMQLPF